jgi:Spy/CpxP family protein refolding chaperone
MILSAGLALSMMSSTVLAQGQGGRPGGGPGGMRGPFGFGGFGGPGGPGGGGSAMLLNMTPIQKELKLTEAQKTKLKKLNTAVANKRQQAFNQAREEGNFDPQAMRKVMEAVQKQQEQGIAGILNKTQKSRLEEIELQREGIFAISREPIAGKLKLTADQTTQVKQAMEEMQTAMREAMPAPPGGGRGFFGRGRRGANGQGDNGAQDQNDIRADGATDDGGQGNPGDDDNGPGGRRGRFGGPPGGGPGGPNFNPEQMRARFEEMRQKMEKIRTDATTKLTQVLTPEQKSSFEKLKGKPFDLATLQPGPGGNRRQGNTGRGNRPSGNTRNRTPGRQRTNQGNAGNAPDDTF